MLGLVLVLILGLALGLVPLPERPKQFSVTPIFLGVRKCASVKNRVRIGIRARVVR